MAGREARSEAASAESTDERQENLLAALDLLIAARALLEPALSVASCLPRRVLAELLSVPPPPPRGSLQPCYAVYHPADASLRGGKQNRT
jgi:hypothetical protein